jgi:hypothetical protein
MKPYIYLNCDNIDIIQDKIYTYLQSLSYYDSTITGWKTLRNLDLLIQVPELQHFLDQHNLVAKRIHVLQHRVSSDLHVDYHSHSDRFRMNFPVRNTINTAITEFYELIDMKKTVAYNKSNIPYYVLSYSDKKLIDSYVLTNPVIIDTSCPHIVQIDGRLDPIRTMISIDFVNDIYHLLN